MRNHMLWTLLTAFVLLPHISDSTSRGQAARELEAAVERAQRGRGAGESAWQALEAGVQEARSTLGPDSELATELARLARGARFEGFLAGNDGAAWLADRLAEVVSDLRFEPVREADLPAGFPDYTPVGEIRIQRYPAYRMARTDMGPNGQRAFWRLFEHIQENEISMTAPVETTFNGDVQSSMAFLYASTELGDTGTQGPVEVVDVPARAAVSIGMRGVESSQRIERARLSLERWMGEHPQWRPSGPLRTMGYNSPMVRGESRYFEVQIPVTSASEIVIDFSDPAEANRWRAVDDVVMGGRSSSLMVSTEEGTTAFTGTLSLENNGGFASVRTTGERCSLAGATSVVLRVRGDGQAYRLRCRTNSRFDGFSYQAGFETRAGEWMNVTLDLADFEPRWRGRLVVRAPALDPTAVQGLGLMIADEQEGPFRLELRSLAMVTDAGAE